MARASKPERRQATNRGLVTRSRGKLLVLSVGTILFLYLMYRLATPFAPALVWSVTAAVVTHPLVRRLGQWVQSPTLRAAISVTVVAVALFLPVISLGFYGSIEIGRVVSRWQDPDVLKTWQEKLPDDPRFNATLNWLSENLNLGASVQQLAEAVQRNAMAAVSGVVYAAVQTLLTLFILFYLYRDEPRVLKAFQRLSPLNTRETNELLTRLRNTVYATMYGIVAVAFVQGTLGGLMFWILGLPAPVLWGLVMGVLALIPYLGAFVVWAPAAVYLAVDGSWGKAIVLTVWGMIVVGLIDNVLYPMLVGDRLRQHTVVTFIAIVGGIAIFGASGIVLGPVVVTVTLFLLEIWRRRTDHGAAAEIA